MNKSQAAQFVRSVRIVNLPNVSTFAAALWLLISSSEARPSAHKKKK